MSYFDDIKARFPHPDAEWPGMARYAAMAADDREYLLSLVDELALTLREAHDELTNCGHEELPECECKIAAALERLK